MTTKIVQVEINLYRDWLDWIGTETDRLRAFGFRFQTYEEWKNDPGQRHPPADAPEEKWVEKFKLERMHLFINFRRRFIDERPRSIEYSKDFNCPDEYKEGLMLLETRIREGRSLFPHMTTGLFEPDSRDDMLLDWRIHHFHIGDGAHSKHPQMVSRTGDIVYAWVEPDTVYFVTLSPHGRWADVELLEIVYRDFPHLLAQHESKTLSPMIPPLTEKERIAIRKKNGNVTVDIDGRVFFPPGGGRNSAGGSRDEIRNIDRWHDWCKQAEKVIIDSIQQAHAGNGCEKTPLPPRMRLTTILRERRKLVLHDKDNSLKVTLHFHENGRDFESVQIGPL